MRRKVERAPLSHRAVGVQLGLAHDIGTRTHINAVLPMLPEQHRVFTGAETGRWLNWSLPTVAAPEPAPAGGSIVEPFAPVGPSSDEGDAEATRAVADQAVEALAQHHRVEAAVRHVREPRQFQDDMNLCRGELRGLSPAASPLALFAHARPIDGLFLAGQTTYPGYGVSFAVMSGVLAADRITAARLGAGPQLACAAGGADAGGFTAPERCPAIECRDDAAVASRSAALRWRGDAATIGERRPRCD